jgi:Amt family ammonium transporter
MCLNGTLGGMVAICSGCDVYRQWSAVVIGVIGGLCTLGTHFAMLKLKLDDPLDAVAVHLGAGIPGFLLPAFFAQGEGIFWKGDTAEAWTQLGVNVGCGLVVVAWTCFWCILIFGSLNFFNMLRIDRDTEVKGVDLIKHGESAYPALAWVEAQYNIKTIVDGRDDTKDIPMYMTSPKNDSKKPKENNDSGVDNSAYL